MHAPPTPGGSPVLLHRLLDGLPPSQLEIVTGWNLRRPVRAGGPLVLRGRYHFVPKKGLAGNRFRVGRAVNAAVNVTLAKLAGITAARVAGGTLAKAFLRVMGVEVRSHVPQIGPIAVPPRDRPLDLEDFEGVDDDPVRCLDPETSRAMVEHINAQRKANESIGGTFEVAVFGLVPGLGSHVSWEERIDGRLAGAVCSIQACKGVEFGDGFRLAATPGSQAHDEIFHDGSRGGFHRPTNHAGGLEGGMTTGDTLLLRAAMKPIPTLTKPLRSVDIDTLEPAEALRERTDSCVVPAAGVVGEAMVAYVLADAYRRKFGGDHIEDVLEALDRYRERIGWQVRSSS
jgi:chorismate synthase